LKEIRKGEDRYFNSVARIECDSENRLWITRNNPVQYCFTEEKELIVRFLHLPTPVPLAQALSIPFLKIAMEISVLEHRQVFLSKRRAAYLRHCT